MRDARVDFNDIEGRHTIALLKFVEPGVPLRVGATLVVGDYDHNLCDATVTAVYSSVVHSTSIWTRSGPLLRIRQRPA